MTRLRILLRNMFYRDRVEADLDDEMRSFVRLKTDENIARGLSPAEARRAALVECGGVEQLKESVREVRAGALVEQCLQDIRFGLRMLRKNPGFTLVAVLTIALGIGVNAGIFSIINAVAMQPLPVTDAGGVVSVYQVFEGKWGRNVHGHSSMFSYPEYLEYRDHNPVFSGLTAFAPFVPASFSTTGRQLIGQVASCNYFDVLRVPLAMGRGFLASECAVEGGEPVVVLSDAAWRSEFGADPGILGKTIRLNRQPVLVVGVTAAGFTGTDLVAAYFWAPVTMQHAIEGGDASRLADHNLSWLVMLGRLKDGVTLSQAKARLETIAAHIDQEYPGRRTSLSIGTASLLDFPDAKKAVLGVSTVLLLAVGMVLLIVCANVANLMLARAAGRRREFAVRLAVGAGKGRLVRQLLTESLLLSTLGGAFGLLVATWSSRAAVVAMLQSLPAGAPTLAFHVAPDYRVFVYTFLLAMLSGVAFGLVPAYQVTRADLNHDLKREGTDADTHGGRKTFLRHALVGSQVAFCMLLLVAAGLLLRGLQRAQTRDPGFRMDHITVASLDLKAAGYTAERAVIFHRRLQERLLGMPGIEDVAHTTITQISGGRRSEGYTLPGLGQRDLNCAQISPEYFEVLEIPLVRGRNFTAAEAAAGSRLGIVTESTARTLWPGEDPIGKHLASSPDNDREIIAVARDTDTVHLGRSNEPFLYELARASDYADAHLLVKSRVDLAATTAAIRAAARDIDPELPVQVAPLSDNLELLFAPSRMGVAFAAFVGALALVIAAIGIYGTVAYSVGRRIREIGIRMALGARGANVILMIIKQGMRPVAAGAVLGIFASLAASRLLTVLLFGMSPFDPPAYLSVVAFLMVVALLATYLPARRALRVDPMAAIRHE